MVKKVLIAFFGCSLVSISGGTKEQRPIAPIPLIAGIREAERILAAYPIYSQARFVDTGTKAPKRWTMDLHGIHILQSTSQRLALRERIFNEQQAVEVISGTPFFERVLTCRAILSEAPTQDDAGLSFTALLKFGRRAKIMTVTLKLSGELSEEKAAQLLGAAVGSEISLKLRATEVSFGEEEGYFIISWVWGDLLDIKAFTLPTKSR
jgi:hypothetical protein